ncbi:FecR family protein [Sphingomonas sp. Tas61C01]|uniref:FecR family protein n=1 Tax=Sphingomonas sp. Tas61C01 TaxID=3458297 RepID=UPI00403EB31F
MTETRTTTEDAAATWHARLAAPDMPWEAFAEWLDTDPAHRTAYDAIALLDAEIGEAAPAIARLLPANDDAEQATDGVSRSTRWRWVAAGTSGAVAAGIALLAIAPATDDAAQTYVTGRSETRAVKLADGSRVDMDRGSRLSVAGGDAPVIELAQGAARFAVRHDPSRVLMVRAGGYEIRDLGTRFAVVNAGGRVSVSVAEGAVSVTPVGGTAADATMLTAGQGIDVLLAQNIAQRRTIDPARVADWSDGRLDYDAAPLTLVAAEISRYVDHPLVVDPSAANLRFSGVLTIGDGSRLVDQLRAVMPIRVRRVGGVVHLGAAVER